MGWLMRDGIGFLPFDAYLEPCPQAVTIKEPSAELASNCRSSIPFQEDSRH